MFGLFWNDLLLRDQLLFIALILHQEAIRLYNAGKPKQDNTTTSIMRHMYITFLNPSASSGWLCPVQGTPPTFIPKTATVKNKKVR